MKNLQFAFIGFLTFCCSFGSIERAWAFPEMIKHGYVHCSACHFNPGGGGTLTPYGKSMSAEVLSTWNYKGSERIFHGALSKNASSYLQGEKDPGFILGGDIRWLQLYRENKTLRQKKFFLMQADVEAGATWKKLLFLTTLGQEKIGDDEQWRFRKTFLRVQATESISAKVGRAQPNLGVMMSEHFLSSRSDSGLGPLENKDLVEVQGNYENYAFVVGAEKNPYEKDDSPSEEWGAYVQGEYIVDTYKFGLHYFHRDADAFDRHRIGAHSMLGISKKWAVLTDWQFQQELLTGRERNWGFFGSGKVTYEPLKGLWLSLWLDYAQRDLSNNDTGRKRLGPGFQFFPLPHFEVQALWLREYQHRTDEWGDYAMLILHYYL